MLSLEKEDPLIWEEFMAGNFCVQKSHIPHTAIPHLQVSKILKIKGGIVRITSNPNSRMRFFLTAPILAKLSEDLKELSSSTTKESQNIPRRQTIFDKEAKSTRPQTILLFE